MNIGDTLKKLRENNGMTRKDAADKLHELGIDISDKTLYGYESGRNSANADMFLALCRIYKCNNIMETFSNSVDDVLFTNAEWEIIEKYRSLDPYGRETVNYILDRETKRVQQLHDVQNTLPAALRIYTYMHKIACAGKGFYFDDIPTDTIEAPYREDADFIIGISGDSMEPTYSDGDLVYVEKCQIVKTGEIGIFILNGECFIKEAGEHGLKSHNSEYDEIPGSENIICVGRVLGKVENTSDAE